jgi:hypothetical protein
MTLDQVPAGAPVFVDANILVYHFQPHPKFGAECQRLIERIERQDIEGFTSTNLLGEMAHRLMMIEVAALPGWSGGKVMNRLSSSRPLSRNCHCSRPRSRRCGNRSSRCLLSNPIWFLQPRSCAGSTAC